LNGLSLISPSDISWSISEHFYTMNIQRTVEVLVDPLAAFTNAEGGRRATMVGN
jgi:hypothetical protein